MSKHTPAPWKINSWETVTIRNEQDEKIAMLAYLKGKHGYMGLRSEAEVSANARLIASAPELLEMLKALVNMPDERSINDISDGELDLWMQAKALIAKAEGEP